MSFVANLQRNPEAFLFSGGSRKGPVPPSPPSPPAPSPPLPSPPPPPPLIFRPNSGPKSPKKVLETAPTGPLSLGLDPALLLHDSY